LTASMTVLYNTSNSVVGATSCGTATLQANGTAITKLTIPLGGPYYIFARVTPPSSSSTDIQCTTTLTTVLSPLWPSTSTAVQRWYSLGGNYAWTDALHESWVGKAYDTSIMEYGGSPPVFARWRRAAGSYHYNMGWFHLNGADSNYYGTGWGGPITGPRPPHVLNHPTPSEVAISDMFYRSSAGSESWFRWGYVAPVTVRRYRMGVTTIDGVNSISPSGAQWTLTGYASVDFSSGTIIATIGWITIMLLVLLLLPLVLLP
jgi:hypothetical protein